jgi:hypothetical protein
MRPVIPAGPVLANHPYGVVRGRPGWCDDAMSDEISQRDIEKAYPGWNTWRGVDNLCHAVRRQGAALTAKGEDWMDLLDQIRRAEVMLEDVPEAWRH